MACGFRVKGLGLCWFLAGIGLQTTGVYLGDYVGDHSKA